jgi:hypothetical protein
MWFVYSTTILIRITTQSKRSSLTVWNAKTFKRLVPKQQEIGTSHNLWKLYLYLQFIGIVFVLLWSSVFLWHHIADRLHKTATPTMCHVVTLHERSNIRDLEFLCYQLSTHQYSCSKSQTSLCPQLKATAFRIACYETKVKCNMTETIVSSVFKTEVTGKVK